jgi:hypothetical protein
MRPDGSAIFPRDERTGNPVFRQSLTPESRKKEETMKKMLLALSGVAVALTAAPTSAKTYTCTKWKDGVCVSVHRVKGTPPFATGYVFGSTYAYTPLSDLPQPVVSYYHLGTNYRYVYNDGYIYVIDPTTYAVIRVIDTLSR